MRLANSYYSQEKYDKAEPLYTRAATIRGKLGKPDAITFGNLAGNYAAQEKYLEAEKWFRKATALLEETPAGDLEIAAGLKREAKNFYLQKKYRAG